PGQSGGLFGNTNLNPQQPGQSGGLFSGASSTINAGTGASTTNTQPALFGPQPSTTQGQNTSAGLFTGTQPTGTGLFGTGTTSGVQNQTSGGLFGSGTTPNQPQTGGSLFGNPTSNQSQTGGGLFGNSATPNQPQTGGGLFGNTATHGQPQTGGGLFGGGAAAQNQPQAGGSLFGNSNLFGSTATGNQGISGTGITGPFGGQQQPASSGLFGNTGASSTTQPTSGGLFGNTGASTITQPTGSLFGNTMQQPAASSGLFGSSTTTQQQPPMGGGLFGTSTAQQQPLMGGGLFGGTTTQQHPAAGVGAGTLFSSSTTPGIGLFGSTNTGTTGAGTMSNLLGGQMAQQPTSGLLSGSNTLGGGGLLSTKLSTAPTQSQADPQTQFAQLQQRIEAIIGAWNPASPLNRFHHYFYNLVNPSQVHLYGRPSNATDESLWQKAVRENPDSTCLVPVLATGFDDLQKRVEAQTQQATAHQDKLREIRARIEKLSERHVLTNAPRLQKLANAQAQLTLRLLRLVQHLHLLIPALRSSSIRPEEEALRAALEEIDGEIRRPGGMGRIIGKLNELWALVGAVNAMRGATSKGSTDGVEWAVVDEEGLNQIVQILGEQQVGLTHLTKILQKDLRDIGVIYGEEMTEEDKPPVDLLTSFTRSNRDSRG
ncbi:nucleoporin complex subunit 54-domain-containing protein, partial [Multifurca ochricompacta]